MSVHSVGVREQHHPSKKLHSEENIPFGTYFHMSPHCFDCLNFLINCVKQSATGTSFQYGLSPPFAPNARKDRIYLCDLKYTSPCSYFLQFGNKLS